MVGATLVDTAGFVVAGPRLEQLGLAGERFIFMAGSPSAGLSFSAGRTGTDCCDDLRGRAWAEHLCHRERLPVVDICDRFLPCTAVLDMFHLTLTIAVEKRRA